MIRPKHLWTALLVLCVLAALKGSWDLGRVLVLEGHGAIDSDSSLYFTVGRGILNGLTPYVELFESKPPGMFLLSALSLLVTGNELLALALQLFVFAAIPVLLGVFAWGEAKHRVPVERAVFAVAAFAAGTAMSLYVEDRAGGIQSESFASFFGFLFLLLAMRDTGKFSWKRTGLLALTLLLAIGTKEPFMISIAAAAIVVLGISKQFLRSFALPLCIAGIVGILALALFGWLGPYLNVYLPSMKGHVNSSPFDPALIRGFTPGRLYGNIAIFYTAPLFGWMLGALWFLLPLLNDRRRARLFDIGTTIVQSAVAYFALLYAFFFIVSWNVWRLGYELNAPFNPFPVWVYLLLVAAALALLAIQWKQRRLRQSLDAILAIYLSAAAVGISIYARNHYAFAVPAYLAMVLVFFRYAPREHAHAAIVFPVIGLILAGSLAYTPSPEHLAELASRTEFSSFAHAEAVAKADALLTACDIERFGGVRTYDILAFTKHSPLGPLIQPSFFEFLGKGHPLFVESERRIEEDASVVFVRGEPDNENVKTSLQQKFTDAAPDCAKPYLPIEGLRVLFRKK